jgi:hypothetical protein
MGTDADRPSGFAESDIGPAQFDIDKVAPIGIDWIDGFNFIPLEMPRHQSMIKNPVLINREYDRISESTPTETLHEKANRQAATPGKAI